jgi:hypothetical protein
VRLLLVEMIGPRVAEALRARGIDAVAVVESPYLRALPDERILGHAQEQELVLVTRNVGDFGRLDQRWHAEGRLHHGLIMVTEQAFPQNRNLVGALVHALVAAAASWPGPGQVRWLRPTGGTPGR